MTAIDLGSNTFRAVEMDCQTLEPIAEYEKIVRTADGLQATGRVSHEAVLRIVAAANEAKKILDFSHGVTAVTTEAIRRAVNGVEVLHEIEERTGLTFRILSGEEEARYTLLAVKTRLEKLGMKSDVFVLADIGGGSTEIIFFHKGRIVAKSFPIGIVTVAQRYGTLEAIEKALDEVMGPIYRWVRSCREEGFETSRFVATAGTPTTVAAMKLGMTYESYDAARINGTTLHKEELGFYLQKLLSMPFEQREENVGTGRSDLIAAGILIYQRLFELLEFDSGIVIDDGLREGVALDMCRKL